MAQKIYDLAIVRKKIEYYCAYQERCQLEVSKKLKQLGVSKNTADILMVELIQGNFLNEMRYAEAFASGKFRIKKWGRHKIKQKLKQNAISDNAINKALESLDQNEYLETLNFLIEKKSELLKNKGQNKFDLRANLQKYLFNKGYEFELVNECLGEI